MNFFDNDDFVVDKKYTNKVKTIKYLPKNIKPTLYELIDKTKSLKLINNIKNSNISEEEKQFLIEASKRHLIFDYSKIADYYSHASKEMQELMEESGLVIIDFNKAIENGYVELSKKIRNQYIKENL